MQQQRQADEADGTGDAAGDDGHALLLLDGHEQRVDGLRRQQADRVAQQQKQDAEMKQIGAPEQLPFAQELAGAGFPGVLLAVEPQNAAEDEGRQADVGIPDEQDVKDGVAHWPAPQTRVAGDRVTIVGGCVAVGASSARRRPADLTQLGRPARPCRRHRPLPARTSRLPPPRPRRAPRGRRVRGRARRAVPPARPRRASPSTRRPAHRTLPHTGSRAWPVAPAAPPGRAPAARPTRAPRAAHALRQTQETAAGNRAARRPSAYSRRPRRA